MLTAAQRSDRARSGGRAMVRKYGNAGMRQLSRKAAKARTAGDRTLPTNDEFLLTDEGRKAAAAIAAGLGLSANYWTPRKGLQVLPLNAKGPAGAATPAGQNQSH